jgi:hypothetical protein
MVAIAQHLRGFQWSLVLAVVCVTSLSGCRVAHRVAHDVSLRCDSTKDGSLHFTFSSRNINGVFQWFCWSESKAEPLWAVRSLGRIEPSDMANLKYGELPNVASPGGIGLKQVFPRKGKPRVVEPGERFGVLIAYQYDDLSPCVGYNTSYFVVEKDGSVTALNSGRGFPDMLPEVGKVWEKVFDPSLDDKQ